jgi:hypothetical protein
MPNHDARIQSAIQEARERERQAEALEQMLSATMEAPALIRQIVTGAVGIGTSPAGVPVLMIALLTGERFDLELQPQVQRQIIDGLQFAANLAEAGSNGSPSAA